MYKCNARKKSSNSTIQHREKLHCGTPTSELFIRIISNSTIPPREKHHVGTPTSQIFSGKMPQRQPTDRLTTTGANQNESNQRVTRSTAVAPDQHFVKHRTNSNTEGAETNQSHAFKNNSIFLPLT